MVDWVKTNFKDFESRVSRVSPSGVRQAYDSQTHSRHGYLFTDIYLFTEIHFCAVVGNETRHLLKQNLFFHLIISLASNELVIS